MLLTYVGRKPRDRFALVWIVALLVCAHASGQTNSQYRSGSVRYSGYGSITSTSSSQDPPGTYGANVLGSPERAAYDASLRYANEQRMARIRYLYSDVGSVGYGRVNTVTGTIGYSGAPEGYGRVNTTSGTIGYSGAPGGYGGVDTLYGSVRYHGDTSTRSRLSTSSGSIRYSGYSTLRTGGVGSP